MGTVAVARPRKVPKASVALSIPDEQLVRHKDLAYEDGYSDAVSWGKDGYFISSNYNEDSKLRYLQGFTLGLRVYKLQNG